MMIRTSWPRFGGAFSLWNQSRRSELSFRWGSEDPHSAGTTSTTFDFGSPRFGGAFLSRPCPRRESKLVVASARERAAVTAQRYAAVWQRRRLAERLSPKS